MNCLIFAVVVLCLIKLNVKVTRTIDVHVWYIESMWGNVIIVWVVIEKTQMKALLIRLCNMTGSMNFRYDMNEREMWLWKEK